MRPQTADGAEAACRPSLVQFWHSLSISPDWWRSLAYFLMGEQQGYVNRTALLKLTRSNRLFHNSCCRARQFSKQPVAAQYFRFLLLSSSGPHYHCCRAKGSVQDSTVTSTAPLRKDLYPFCLRFMAPGATPRFGKQVWSRCIPRRKGRRARKVDEW